LESRWKFTLNKEDHFVDQKILEVHLGEDGHVKKRWVDIKPIPQSNLWFEELWKEYREDNVIS